MLVTWCLLLIGLASCLFPLVDHGKPYVAKPYVSPAVRVDVWDASHAKSQSLEKASSPTGECYSATFILEVPAPVGDPYRARIVGFDALKCAYSESNAEPASIVDVQTQQHDGSWITAERWVLQTGRIRDMQVFTHHGQHWLALSYRGVVASVSLFYLEPSPGYSLRLLLDGFFRNSEYAELSLLPDDNQPQVLLRHFGGFTDGAGRACNYGEIALPLVPHCDDGLDRLHTALNWQSKGKVHLTEGDQYGRKLLDDWPPKLVEGTPWHRGDGPPAIGETEWTVSTHRLATWTCF